MLAPVTGSTAAVRPEAVRAKAARDFEALVIKQMLATVQATRLGDDLMGDGGDTVRGFILEHQAHVLAAGAPFGLGTLLEKTR